MGAELGQAAHDNIGHHLGMGTGGFASAPSSIGHHLGMGTGGFASAPSSIASVLSAEYPADATVAAAMPMAMDAYALATEESYDHLFCAELLNTAEPMSSLYAVFS
jgi:hypothetical protein